MTRHILKITALLILAVACASAQQRLDPSSEISISNFSYYGTPGDYQNLADGASANDDNSIIGYSEGALAKYALSNPAATPGSGTCTATFRFAWENGEGGGSNYVIFYIKEGANTRGTVSTDWGYNYASLTYYQVTCQFDASTVSNFNDLEAWAYLKDDSGLGYDGWYVSWIKLDVPAGAAASAKKKVLN